MRFLLILNLFLPLLTCGQSTSWINEIHYDNTGVDSLEFVEILAASNNLKIYAYNGATGLPYDSALVDTLVYHQFSGFRLHVWYPELLQNGPGDGICLTSDDSVIHAIAYEKSFTAIDGPAAGEVFPDIGASEDTYTPIGFSLQISGKGERPKHFIWEQDSLWTPGKLNKGQQITSQPVLYLDCPIDSIRFNKTPVGYHSASRTLTVRGSNLHEPIRIYPPEGFTIDTNQYFNQPIAIGQYLELTPSNGCLPPTDVFLRFEPVNPTGILQCGILTLSNPETEGLRVITCGEEGYYDFPRMWINEFHYDDIGTDTLEFVELAVQHAERYDSEDIQLFAYNGGNGTHYRDYALHEMTAYSTPDPAWSLFVMNIPQLQNGPDGFALCYRDSCHQFLSYEGEFMALNGPAFGQWSTDFGLQEFPDSPNLSSLQLIGEGKQLSDFIWLYTPGTNTRGLPNISQILPLKLLESQLQRIENHVQVSWKVANNDNVLGYKLSTSTEGHTWDSLAWLDPNANGDHTFTYEDPSTHYLQLSCLTLENEVILLKTIKVTGAPVLEWSLTSEEILFSPIAQTNVSIDIVNISGQIIQRLSDRIINHRLALNHWLDVLPSGTYLLRIAHPNRPAPKVLRFSR